MINKFTIILFTLLISFIVLSATTHASTGLPCKTNQECPPQEHCISGACRTITCDCGHIENHACIQYECCSNLDCNVGQKCANHVCVLGDLMNIDINPKQPVLGDIIKITVSSEEGYPIQQAKVDIKEDDKNTIEKYTDSLGIVKIEAEDKHITLNVEKQGYRSQNIEILVKDKNNTATQTKAVKTKDCWLCKSIGIKLNCTLCYALFGTLGLILIGMSAAILFGWKQMKKELEQEFIRKHKESKKWSELIVKK